MACMPCHSRILKESHFPHVKTGRITGRADSGSIGHGSKGGMGHIFDGSEGAWPILNRSINGPKANWLWVNI